MRISRHGIYSLILGLLVCLLYGQFLENPVFFDDLPFFMLGRDGSLPIESDHWDVAQLRSLPYATLNWTAAFFGLGVVYFHIGNMLLHGLVVLSLFYFLRQLIAQGMTEDEMPSVRKDSLAFFASLVFALNPVAVYAVGYLVQRTIVMATLFGLLTLLVYTQGSLSGKRYWLWLSVPCYYLAVFSKEHAIMLPAVLLALTVLLHEDWREKLRQRWQIFIALAVVACWVVLAKIGIFGSVYEIAAGEMAANIDPSKIYSLSILTQSGLYFKYLFLWLVPNPSWMSIDMREPFAASLYSSYLLAFFAYIAWGLVAGYGLFKRGRFALLGFAMLVPWLLFMTEFSAVRIQESMVLYRSYLWMIGIPIALVWGLGQFNLRLIGLLSVSVIVLMFPLALERLSSFSHPFLLWDDASRLLNGRDDLPGASRIYNNRGNELLKLNRFPEAVMDLQRAAKLSPNLPSTYNNIGVAYLKQNKFSEAVEQFGKSISIMEKSGQKTVDTRPYRGRAMSLEAIGHIREALADYQVDCNLSGKSCDKVEMLKAK